MPLHLQISILEDQKRQEATPLDCKLLLGLMGVIGRDNTDTATSFWIPLTFRPFSFLNFHWNSSSTSHLSHILFSVFQLKLETSLFHLTTLMKWYQSWSCYFCCWRVQSLYLIQTTLMGLWWPKRLTWIGWNRWVPSSTLSSRKQWTSSSLA